MNKVVKVGDEYEVGFAEGKSAGRKQVVDYLNTCRQGPHHDLGDELLYWMVQLPYNIWQAKLKEWGINP